MDQPLHLTMEGTNPLTMLEWIWVSSLSLGENLNLENTKLHCSPLHHIPDIVVLDLDMLRLVMEHWIL